MFPRMFVSSYMPKNSSGENDSLRGSACLHQVFRPSTSLTSCLLSESHLPSVVDNTATVQKQTPENPRLDISGPRNAAVKAYSTWQQSNVVDDALKEEFQKACDATLEDGIDLEQVYEDQDPGFFVQSGIKRGVARRFVSDIDGWAKRYKLSYDT
jgi:hypothetical protein